MLFKKYLSITFIQLKTMGKLFYIPLICLFVVLPVIYILSYHAEGVDGIATSTIIIGQILVPLFSAWWVLMVLREYVESDGNEILFVYGQKSQAVSVVLLWLFYVICTGIQYAFLSVKLPSAGLDFIHASLVSGLYVGFTYFFVYLTKSIAISFIPLLLYSVFCFMNPEIIGFTSSISWFEIASKYLPQFLLGIFFFFLGHMFNKKFLRFN